MRGALAWSGTDFVGCTIQSLTTTQRDATSPSNGAVVYNSTDGKLQMRVGGAWSNVASEAFAGDALDWKDSVTVASTANLTLSGEQTIDGVLTSADRILVKDQSSGSENGIYVTDASAWTRATDFDTDAEVTAGATVFVSEGATQGNQTWQLTTDDPIVVATTALVFAQIAGGGFSGIPQSEPATDNLFVGTGTGGALTTGDYNVCVGTACATVLDTAANNTMFGNQNGEAVTSGSANTLVGSVCGNAITTGQNNVCVGSASGDSLTTEQGNVLVGQATDATGNYNTVVGKSAEGGSGDYNIVVGNQSGPTTNSHTISFHGSPTADNQVIFGSSTTKYYDQFFLGQGVTIAAPIGVTLNATGGLGTDIDGGDFTIAGGRGTGAGDSGDINFQLSQPGGGSGTGARTLYTYGKFRGSDSSFQATYLRNSPELEQTLTDQATVAWDCDSGANATVTIAGNRTMAAPTNIKNGGRYTLHIIQDPTGTRTMGWNSVFKFAGGSTPTLSTGGNDIDIFEFVARGGNLEETNQSLNVS